MKWKRHKHGFYWGQWSIFRFTDDEKTILSSSGDAPWAYFKDLRDAMKFVEHIERNNPHASREKVI